MNQVLLGTLTLQPRRQLLAEGRRLPLGRRALDILSVLAEARGEIVTKDEILAAVWPGVIVEENAIQVHVAALRKALGPEALRLSTVRGVGYRLEVPAQPSPGIERREQKSVAILPFANLTGDPANAYLCEGIARELTTIISRQSDLKVPSWQSAFILGSRNINIRAAARQLGVETVVEGWVKREGDNVRVSAELIDADSGFHIWSGQFDAEIGEVFRLDGDLASSIAGALQTCLETARPATSNAEALDCYLKGMSLRSKAWSGDRFDEVRAHFRRAVDLDGNFAKACAALSQTSASYVIMGIGGTQHLDDAKRMAARALALDPALIEGHIAMANVSLIIGDWRAAEDHSGLEDVCPVRATFCTVAGHLDQATRYLEATLANDPLCSVNMTANSVHAWLRGDLDQAVERMTFAIANGFGARQPPASIILAEAAFAAGDLEKATDHMASTYTIHGLDGEAQDVFRRVYAALAGQGGRELALASLQRFIKSNRHLPPGALIWFLSRLGDLDAAYELAGGLVSDLRRKGAFDFPSLILFWLPDMEAFRMDRRFFGLAQGLGLIGYWQREGLPQALAKHPLAKEFAGRHIAATN